VEFIVADHHRDESIRVQLAADRLLLEGTGAHAIEAVDAAIHFHENHIHTR